MIKTIFKKNNIKVKIFKSSFNDSLEKEINDFFENNHKVKLINSIQSVENNVVYITMFYKQ